VPLEDVVSGVLRESGDRTTFCEWKGLASYYDATAGGKRAERCAWAYHEPTRGFEAIRNAVAFYPAAMDTCWVDEERVEAQPGGFYGGWITSDIVGPFKGRAGTLGW